MMKPNTNKIHVTSGLFTRYRFHVTACAALILFGGCELTQTATSTKGDQRPAPPPERIVSFVPGLTEVAFDLGLGPKVVGVGDFDTYPPEVRKLPKVGGLLNPNLEQTLALKPDLLLLAPSQSDVIALARAKNIPAMVQPTDSLDDLYASFTKLGERAQVEAHSKTRLDALQAQIEALRAPAGPPRPAVLLVVGRDPGSLKGLIAAGESSFLDALLEIAGGRNVLPKDLGLWPSISKEYLLTQQPDIIIEFAPAGDDALRETESARRAWAALPTLKAVKTKRVYKLVGDHLLLPGPRTVKTIKQLRQTIQREAADQD